MSLLRLLVYTARQCLPYLLLVAVFAVFVYANGGLVVRDRSAHEATLHLTQVFYFFLFVVLFSPTLVLNSITGFFALCCRQPKSTAFLLMLTLSIIHNNTLVHPYLLADNRHYTFYLWNRFYARHRYFRYFMSPVYLFGGHLVWNVCLEKRSNVFRLIFISCVALSVVPQRLLEPRYFILPFLIARKQRSPSFATGNEGNGGNGTPLVAETGSRRNSNGRNSEGSRGSSTRSIDGFRGNTARSVDGGFRGNPARLNVRGGHVRNGGRSGNLRGFAIISNFLSAMWKSLKLKVHRFSSGFPLARVGWEFLYYLIINLTTLAVFGSKTFWWRDFAEPQRIMW